MYESSRTHPPKADEVEKAGLTPAPCEVVAAPRVEEAAVNMECLLDRVLQLGTDNLVIGRMVRFHVRGEAPVARSPCRQLHEGRCHLRAARRRFLAEELTSR